MAEIERVQNPKKLSEESVDYWEKASRGEINIGLKRIVDRSILAGFTGWGAASRVSIFDK